MFAPVRLLRVQVGPVISVNHGMGMPSMSILLHELAKLLHYAKATDVVFIRMGTSGGLGLAPGTVVIAESAMNGMIEPFYELPILGERKRFDASFDGDLAREIFECREDTPAVMGKTMATDCFYEGQGRLDGAICEYDAEAKMAFLRRAHEAGVMNVEMEAVYLAAFTRRLGIRSALVCCTLLNRLEGDQVRSSKEELASFAQHSADIVLRYLRKKLSIE